MSRYIIAVAGRDRSDPEAVIGYDRALQTSFLQAFPDAEGEDLALWLGTEYRSLETLIALRMATMADGYDFMPLPTELLRSLVSDYRKEATRLLPDVIVERFLNGGRASD